VGWPHLTGAAFGWVHLSPTDAGPAGSRALRGGATTTELSRPLARITVVTGSGRTVQLISCHFKSKLLSFPHGFAPDNEDQRARYAVYVYRTGCPTDGPSLCQGDLVEHL
jgi:hypothetical protein